MCSYAKLLRHPNRFYTIEATERESAALASRFSVEVITGLKADLRVLRAANPRKINIKVGWADVRRCLGVGGVLICCLPQVIWPLTTHPVRDGNTVPTPYTPLTFGRLLRVFRILHRNFLPILSPSCFAVCGHHLSPRTAIVFSLLSSVPNFSMSHVTSVPPCIFHIIRLCGFYSLLLCHKGASVHLLPPLDYWYTSFFFLAVPGPLHEIVISASSGA